MLDAVWSCVDYGDFHRGMGGQAHASARLTIVDRWTADASSEWWTCPSQGVRWCQFRHRDSNPGRSGEGRVS